MPGKPARKHVKAETDLTKSTGANDPHERANAEPEARDLADPEEVWKDAETTPAADPARRQARGPRKRVADAGDVGAGQASPYGTQAQADALARQTRRTDEPRAVEKPKR